MKISLFIPLKNRAISTIWGCRSLTGACILFGTLISYTLQSCDNQLDDKLILKPNGEPALPAELSAGYSTIFSSSPDAYDTNADWVTGELLTRFNRGDGHAEQEATQAEDWDQYMLDIPAEVAIKVPVVPNRPLPTAVRATDFRPC